MYFAKLVQQLLNSVLVKNLLWFCIFLLQVLKIKLNNTIKHGTGQEINIETLETAPHFFKENHILPHICYTLYSGTSSLNWLYLIYVLAVFCTARQRPILLKNTSYFLQRSKKLHVTKRSSILRLQVVKMN